MALDRNPGCQVGAAVLRDIGILIFPVEIAEIAYFGVPEIQNKKTKLSSLRHSVPELAPAARTSEAHASAPPMASSDCFIFEI
jgi:hypothetical protein